MRDAGIRTIKYVVNRSLYDVWQRAIHVGLEMAMKAGAHPVNEKAALDWIASEILTLYPSGDPGEANPLKSRDRKTKRRRRR